MRGAKPLSVIAALDEYKRPGESLFDTANRVLVEEALRESDGNQYAAAKALGVSPRVLNYKAAKCGLRPKDRRHHGKTP